MSLPTVLTIVNELKEAGFIKENGEFGSTGGRKAKAISAIQEAGFAIGLDITQNHIGMIVTDLSKKSLSYERMRFPFRNDEGYYSELGDIIKTYIKTQAIPVEKILGIGIAVPGIVDEKENRITFSHALNVRNLPICDITDKIPYKVTVINDASAGAMAECIHKRAEENMVYLSLSNTVGGAIVLGHQRYTNDYRNFYKGDGFKSAEFGHIVIKPEGKTCYCKKQGCLDAYCSAPCLAKHTGGYLELFFEKMEQGNKEYQEIWESYLDYLALGIDTLRITFDCEIVLGGYVGYRIEPYMNQLRSKVKKTDIFGETGGYLRSSRYKTQATALGAATFLIDNFIDSI